MPVVFHTGGRGADHERATPPLLPTLGVTTPLHLRPGHISCNGCWLEHACMQHGEAELAWLHLNTVKRRVPRGAAVYRANDTFHSIFAVRSGMCKSVAVSSHGEQKIVALHVPGEMFGLGGISVGAYTYDVVAVDESEICAVPYSQLLLLARHNEPLQQALLRVISSAIGWHRTLLERLEALSAEARVIALILNLSERYARCGYPPNEFPMRLKRLDVGNYLGLAHETVTRVLSQLCKQGIIRLTEGDVQIKDRDLLRQSLSGTPTHKLAGEREQADREHR